MNCSSDLKIFANSQPSAWNFKSFSRSLEQFFLTVGQNNFGNKIPFHTMYESAKVEALWFNFILLSHGTVKGIDFWLNQVNFFIIMNLKTGAAKIVVAN